MTEKFQTAWNAATELERVEIIKLMDSCKKYEFVAKLKNLLKGDIGAMSVNDLRIMASALGVRYYASLNKAGILAALKGAGV
jgi:hypothetical protein